MTNDVAQAFLDAEQTDAVPIAETFQERLTRYAELTNQLRKHEGSVDSLKAELKELEEPLLNDMAEAGIQSVNCAGLNIHKRTDFYVSKKGEVATAAIVETMRQHGLGYLIAEGYNANSLKSVIKEWREEEREVPPDLAAQLNIGETVKLATRKA